jgi:hypothetical protein
MEKVYLKRGLNESTVKQDLNFWMSCSPEERISAVEYLRKLYYGDTGRLQRSVKIIQRTRS